MSKILSITTNKILFISFFKTNFLEMIVILILLFLLRLLRKHMKLSKLVRLTLGDNYALYNFTKDSKDENSKRRLITAIITDIKRTHPHIKIMGAEFLVKLEVNAMLQPIYIRLFFYLLKLLRIFFILILIGLIILFIIIMFENMKETTLPNDVVSQLTEDINRNSLDNVIAISNYHLENQILVRSVFISIFNVFIALFFVFLINLIAPVSLNGNIIIYIMLLIIGIIGSFSMVGLGFIVASLVWKFNIRLPIIILSQILLTLLIFASPLESFLVPFSNAKLFVINLFDGYIPDFQFFLKYCIMILINSILYLAFGYIFFKITRMTITMNKIKGWNHKNDN